MDGPNMVEEKSGLSDDELLSPLAERVRVGGDNTESESEDEGDEKDEDDGLCCRSRR